MPPKGYVGFEVTPRRKILLQEIMQAEGYRKPQEAVDFALRNTDPTKWVCSTPGAGHPVYKTQRGLVIHLIDIHHSMLVDPRTGIGAGQQHIRFPAKEDETVI